LANGDLPAIEGVATGAGKILLTPTSITFLAVPDAGNGSPSAGDRPARDGLGFDSG
jgi:hypothetical protein